MKPSFPWYDSWWLAYFIKARQFIEATRPSRLKEFTEAFEPFKTRSDFDVRLIDRFFDDAQVATIDAAFRSIKPQSLETHELSQHGRFVVHDHPALLALHQAVAPAVGECVGEAVEPAYSFIALYNANGRCPLHLDAPVSKWTLDFCIEQSEPWPISFSQVVPWPESFDAGLDGWEDAIKRASGPRFSSVVMEPGQAVIFSGSSQWHFRDPMPNAGPTSHCSLLFLHFMPAGMAELAEWTNWERRFDLPGLTEAIR